VGTAFPRTCNAGRKKIPDAKRPGVFVSKHFLIISRRDDATAGRDERAAAAVHGGADQFEAETKAEAHAHAAKVPSAKSADGEVMTTKSTAATKAMAAAKASGGSLGRSERHRTQRRHRDKSNDNFAQHLIDLLC
jgi:hypothetical protein